MTLPACVALPRLSPAPSISSKGRLRALVDSVRHSIAGCEADLARLDKKLQKIQRLSSEPAVLNLLLRLRYAFQGKTLAKLNAIMHGDLLGNLRLALVALNL
jgi:hypothetical protein